MKEQMILEILHLLPHYTSDQLYEVKEAVRIVLCKYNVSSKETALQVVNNSSLHYLQIYLESCEQAGKSRGTVSLYRFHISHFLSYANKDITQINDDDVYTYLYNYRHQRTVSKKPLSSAEVELIRSSCGSERDLSIVEYLYSTAVRASELLRLNRSDISFSKDDITVLGKGNRERVTYLNARAHIHLKNYLDSRTDDNPALFVSCKAPHKRLTRRGLEDIINRIATSAQVEHVHPHRFRRTNATDLLNAGMPIEQVQELLGHKSIETTRIYCTVSQESVRYNHKRYMNF